MSKSLEDMADRNLALFSAALLRMLSLVAHHFHELLDVIHKQP
jgi:hypothetical protein